MKKVIAAFNMTLDGVCDHTTGIADEELHQHYSELIDNGGVILYGRTTYQLMQFWQELLKKPSGEKSMDDFAMAIDNISKIVFSHTLQTVDWKTATLADRDLKETVLAKRQQDGKAIYVGSRSLILQLMKLQLIDEYQIIVYPVVAGAGLPLFDDTCDRTLLTLVKTKTFKSGAVLLYYVPKL